MRQPASLTCACDMVLCMMTDYKHLFIGHSTNHCNRAHGSSGGVATEILEYLLSHHVVDRVIGVGFDDHNKALPVYKSISLPGQAQGLSGSKYVYMPLAPLVDLIERSSAQRLAVVAQPCFAQTLREKYPGIFLLSFFCGYNMDWDATKYLLNKARVTVENVAAVNYRAGEKSGGFTVAAKDGRVKNFGKEYYELINLMFLRKGCGQCSIYITDKADIVLGDAWIKNTFKENVILSLSACGDGALKSMWEKNLLQLYALSQEELWRMHRHNIRAKAHGHSLFLRILIKILNNAVARRLAPFHLCALISRWRRHFFVGIPKQLVAINGFNS